jgi:hypothetical protein
MLRGVPIMMMRRPAMTRAAGAGRDRGSGDPVIL